MTDTWTADGITYRARRSRTGAAVVAIEFRHADDGDWTRHVVFPDWGEMHNCIFVHPEDRSHMVRPPFGVVAA